MRGVHFRGLFCPGLSSWWRTRPQTTTEVADRKSAASLFGTYLRAAWLWLPFCDIALLQKFPTCQLSLTAMQFAPNRLKYLHEAGGGELGVEVECDFSANSREARGKQTKATCCVDHTAAYCAISPQVATADSTLAVAFRKTEASTGGQTHRTEHTEVMWGHPAKQTCASYHVSPY